MTTEKKIIGSCPLCGGNVVKTCKGYRCENNMGEHPSCVLKINAILGNRKMNDSEVTELLANRSILLDGFATKEGKTFPTVLENWLMTATSICRRLSANVLIVAAKSVWEAGLSTVPTMAIRKPLVRLPSGGTLAGIR